MVQLQRQLLLFFFLILLACGTPEYKTVVLKIGDIQITEGEFRRRFEFNPRMLQFKNLQEAKYRYLGSLAAEKLLAQAVTSPETRRNQAFLNQIRREAVIEELYNLQTDDQVTISDEEVRQAFERSRVTLKVMSARFDSLKEAKAFTAAARQEGSSPLNGGAGARSDPNRRSVSIESATVTWGSADPAFEDILYDMKPGEISEPLAVNNQYHVLQVLERQVNAFATETEFRLRKAKIAQKLTQRKRGQAFMAFFKDMMAGKTTDVASQRIHGIVARLAEGFNIGFEQSELIRAENPGPLNDVELADALSQIDDLRDVTLVHFEDGQLWNVEDFLERLSVGRHHIDFGDRQKFRTSIRQALITMIEQEYVYLEGLKRGIDRSAYVVDEVAMWRENLAAHASMQSMLDSDPSPPNGEPDHLDDEQLRQLTEKLTELLASKQIEFDRLRFEALDLKNAGLLVLKTHFPGRMIVPINIPLENLEAWQTALMARLMAPTADKR